MDIDDDNERPTLPSPITHESAHSRAFDTAAEAFFAVPLAAMAASEEQARRGEEADAEAALWWLEQRRRSLQALVAMMMLVCAALLATALFGSAIFALV